MKKRVFLVFVIAALAAMSCSNSTGAIDDGSTTIIDPYDWVTYKTTVDDVVFKVSDWTGVLGAYADEIAWNKVDEMIEQSKIIEKQYSMWEQELRAKQPQRRQLSRHKLILQKQYRIHKRLFKICVTTVGIR